MLLAELYLFLAEWSVELSLFVGVDLDATNHSFDDGSLEYVLLVAWANFPYLNVLVGYLLELRLLFVLNNCFLNSLNLV